MNNGIGSLMVGLAALAGCHDATAEAAKDSSLAETAPGVNETVVTNANGSVTKTRTETSVKKENGFKTERKAVSCVTTDKNGNVISESTREYVSTSSDDETPPVVAAKPTEAKPDAAQPAEADATASFMGVKFGDVLDAKDAVKCEEEPVLPRVKITPKKALAGFDDYYAYLTPKTHRVVKICACSKKGVPPTGNWRRHYLVEALENHYGVWAVPCSWSRPYYRFDVSPSRTVTACLAGASDEYETVVSAWDQNMADAATDEWYAIREEARKAALEARAAEVKEAQSAF